MAIADVWGFEQVPEPAEVFEPHVTFAYIDTEGMSTEFVKAIEKAETEPATVEIREASLIVLNRDDRMYRLQTHTYAKIGRGFGTPVPTR